jgi:hypothetical protein
MAKTGTFLSPEWCMIRPPQSKTYAKRAQECRHLARISPPHWRGAYLQLGAKYERLARGAAKEFNVSGVPRDRAVQRAA